VTRRKKTKHKINRLKRQQNQLFTKLNDIKTLHDIDETIFSFDIWLDLLKDPYLRGSGNDRHLNLFEMRERLREQQKDEKESLEKVTSEIFIEDLDLLLYKISLIQDKLDNN